jgi:hypothetical protein
MRQFAELSGVRSSLWCFIEFLTFGVLLSAEECNVLRISSMKQTNQFNAIGDGMVGELKFRVRKRLTYFSHRIVSLHTF